MGCGVIAMVGMFGGFRVWLGLVLAMPVAGSRLVAIKTFCSRLVRILLWQLTVHQD